MHSPNAPRPLSDRLAGTSAQVASEVLGILSDAGLWPGFSMDAVIDRIEAETRIRR